ncbi:hypothetical protein B296_00036790, partial [Ensete ventricosum]
PPALTGARPRPCPLPPRAPSRGNTSTSILPTTLCRQRPRPTLFKPCLAYPEYLRFDDDFVPVQLNCYSGLYRNLFRTKLLWSLIHL